MFHLTKGFIVGLPDILQLDALLQTAIKYLPPANIATKTIPQDHMSAGSALYSPLDRTYKGTEQVSNKYFCDDKMKKYFVNIY